MHARILPLLLLVLSANIQAIEFPVEIIESMDNARVVASLEAADIDESACWKPFEEAPPLSVEQALEAVHARLAASPELADAVLSGIELKPIPHHENHWHYLVKLETQEQNRSGYRYFIVLMNGKVIPGLREPQAVK